MTVSSGDEIVQRYRDEIAALDRQLVEIVNARLGAVTELHRYKGEQGLPARDLERERWLVEHLQAETPGPLSAEGVAELVDFVLGLIRREQARG
jgi:chorismate mutase